MILQLPNIVGETDLAHIVSVLGDGQWQDGRLANSNHHEPWERDLLRKIENTPKFVSAALPVRCVPPFFRKIDASAQSTLKVHKAVRALGTSGEKARIDLIGLLVLLSPSGGSSGEVALRDSYGEHLFHLKPGTMLLYPASMQQRLPQPEVGYRYYAEIGVQSMVRDDAQRKMLFDMDTAIQVLASEFPTNPQVDKLSGVYHALLRYWARP